MMSRQRTKINLFSLIIITLVALILLCFIVILESLNTIIIHSFIDKNYIQHDNWILLD